MYKKLNSMQISLDDFGQPAGMHLSPNNRWVQKAAAIPWRTLEKDYARLFPAHTGNVAKTFRMAFGALIIQTKYHYSDEELVQKVADLKTELFNLRFRAATGQLENTAVIKGVKKDMARVKTVIRERELKNA